MQLFSLLVFLELADGFKIVMIIMKVTSEIKFTVK